MVNDAKIHEKEDREKKDKVDTRNTADSTLFQSEKQLKEFGDKLSGDAKAKIEAGISRVKEALKNDNYEEMKASVEALNQLWQTASTEMYQQASQASANSATSSGTESTEKGSKDDAVDAEFEEIK